ncbi:hypothetical protein MCZ54_09540 [Bacillus safensis]|uniref:hypothetical protein n=1 Tax=Bacillus safensis TaxID=561879 RepID=UPI0022800E40|nr:hypothetical protein [Bacillus safensis]MCY7465979.1 hypothetical protein [Bacillus safensis]MED0801107.1 hypothetical protein [Bacillus safensis]
MGFWEEEHKKKNIIIGDDGLDIFEEAIEQFYEMNEEHLEIKPTIDEMLLTIMMVLNNGGSHYFDDLNDKEVTDIKIITKKVKTLSKVEPGAIFEFPLKEVGKLSYALGVLVTHQLEQMNRTLDEIVLGWISVVFPNQKLPDDFKKELIRNYKTI